MKNVTSSWSQTLLIGKQSMQYNKLIVKGRKLKLQIVLNCVQQDLSTLRKKGDTLDLRY